MDEIYDNASKLNSLLQLLKESKPKKGLERLKKQNCFTTYPYSLFWLATMEGRRSVECIAQPFVFLFFLSLHHAALPIGLTFFLHTTVFSSDVRKELNTNILDLNKKRKLQAELLDLPSAKHKCWGQSFSSQIVHPLDENTEIEDLHTPIIKEETDGETLDDGSEADSAKDSNSFAGDLDSVLSVYGEAKFEPECEKTCLYSHPYSSSVNCWGVNSFGDNFYSLKSTTRMTPDVSKDKSTCVVEHNPLVSQNPEDQLLEFGNDVDFMSPEYGDEMIERSTDKELADIPYFSGMTPNNFVLSSGRWSVNQGNLHMTLNTFAQRGEDKNAMPLVTCKCKMLKLDQGSLPLIKNLSSIFPC